MTASKVPSTPSSRARNSAVPKVMSTPNLSASSLARSIERGLRSVAVRRCPKRARLIACVPMPQEQSRIDRLPHPVSERRSVSSTSPCHFTASSSCRRSDGTHHQGDRRSLELSAASTFIIAGCQTSAITRFSLGDGFLKLPLRPCSQIKVDNLLCQCQVSHLWPLVESEEPVPPALLLLL